MQQRVVRLAVMQTLKLATVALLLLFGCVVDDPVGLDMDSSAIVGGEFNSGDPAVVALYSETGGQASLCTGTVIAPRVILTAAHCVQGPAPDTHFAYFGSNIVADDPYRIGAIDIIERDWDRQFDLNDLEGGHDIGLVRLASDAPVAPIPVNRVPAEQLVGQGLRLTGFGITGVTVVSLSPQVVVEPNNDSGIKRETTSVISRVDAELVHFGNASTNTCSGDSGGPQLITVDGDEYIVSVTSYGRIDCLADSGGTRVDKYVADFIQPFIGGDAELNATCAADGLCAASCPSPDPDCPCAADGYCTTECTTPDEDTDCPVGCAADGVCVEEGCAVADVDCEGGEAAGGTPDQDPNADTDSPNFVGGCRTSGTSSGGWLMVIGLGLALPLRRRRSGHR